MKKTVFYHIYLTEDLTWVPLLLDQFKIIIDSGLYEEADKIFVSSIVSDESLGQIVEILSTIASNFGNKIILLWVKKNYDDTELSNIDKSKNIITENICLKKIWDYAHSLQENEHIAYIHAKGITSFSRYLNKNKVDYGSYRVVNYHFWRKFLEWGVIEKYKECCEALQENDTAGVNWSKWPVPHYSGGFWWANSNYIKTLNDPTNETWWETYKKRNPSLLNISNRVKDEMWIGSKSSNMFSLKNFSDSPNNLLGDILIKRQEYENYK